MEEGKKYDGLFNIPATDPNFTNGIARLDADELREFHVGLERQENDGGGHKGRIKAVEKEIWQRGEVSPEMRAIEKVAEDIVAAEDLYGDGMPYELERIENEVRFYQDQAGTALLEMGRRLIRIKAHEGSGKFLESLDRLGMAPRSAQYAMLAARKFSNTQAPAYLGSEKMRALAVLDEDDIKTLESGGEVGGMTLDDIDRMTSRELRANLRKEKERAKKEKDARKKEREAFEKSMTQKDAKINELDMKLSNRDLPTKEQIAAVALEDLRRKLFEEIQLTRFHFGECLKVIGAAEKTEGATFPLLENWANKEYAELAGFGPMLEELDEALRYASPGAEGSEGNAD